MGPNDKKDDIYEVMTNSRQLTNFCQESVISRQSKKISTALNNIHLESAIKFLTKSLIDEDQFLSELDEFDFDNQIDSEKQPVYTKVIAYIDNYLIDSYS
tara:strand:- start:472 stop:771 length:300 start_codon:yes stop_codon:yes gene_type:complete